jgi:hypothetical protein
MKSALCLTLLLEISLSCAAASTNLPPAGEEILAGLRAGHPRLLGTTADWEALRARRATDPVLVDFLRRMEVLARDAAKEKPLVYRKEGKRLLAVSREAVRRVALWSFCYRVTGDAQFAQRAKQELLTVAAFSDWNPSHFLDTAEMSAAVALGYDWLYEALDPATRATLRQAMVEKGLKPGLGVKDRLPGWARADNNWNQVCFGGLTLAALAVGDEEPAVAAAVLRAARTNIHNGLSAVAPDGVYPEGPGYWNYGTSYQVVMLAALESALGTDWGLTASPGFLASATAQVRQVGPTGLAFNFSDGGEGVGVRPVFWWFARRMNAPGLLHEQQKLLAKLLDGSDRERRPERMLPFIALWSTDFSQLAPAPELSAAWHGDGVNPIATFRSSWSDPDALYLAFKGGSASGNHAHMDAGSFVFELDGVRWAVDLGMQEYYSIESKGWDLWDRAQNAQRWRVYRLNNYSHNTLTLGGQLHDVTGRARITEFNSTSGTVDLGEIFAGQAQRVTRRFTFGAADAVTIRDELSGLKPGTSVRWQMLTRAQVTPEKSTALLRQEGKALRATLRLPGSGGFQVSPADPPRDGVNAPNRKTRILHATWTAPADGTLSIEVELRRAAGK